MMKLFIPIFITFMSPAFAAWEQYSSSSDGGIIRYMDRSQVVRLDSKVRLPIKLEYLTTVSALEGVLAVTSGLMWFELDCKQIKFRLISLEGYSMPNLKGDITISTESASKFQKDSLLRWHTVTNENHFKTLFSKLC